MKLKALGSGKTKYSYSKPNPKLLERFPNPMNLPSALNTIHIQCPEFTSLCPLTGQPDFAKILITYCPDQWCLESKSLKLYLGGYRQHGEFHESCVNRIAKDLITLLEPHSVEVEGQFTPRGGIPFWPVVRWYKAAVEKK